MTVFLNEKPYIPDRPCSQCGVEYKEGDEGFAREYAPRGVVIWWHSHKCFIPKESYYKKRRFYNRKT